MMYFIAHKDSSTAITELKGVYDLVCMKLDDHHDDHNNGLAIVSCKPASIDAQQITGVT